MLDEWRRKIAALRHRLEAVAVNRSSPEGSYFLVSGMGHCGTKWMSKVLDDPGGGVRCYHEKTVKVAGLDWYEFIRRELTEGPAATAPPYFDFLHAKLSRYRVVGDSNAWRIKSIPQVNEEIEIDRVVYMVRHGLQNVFSSYRSNRKIERGDWLYTDYLRWPWEVAGRPGKDWTDRSRWECWCSFWAHNEDLVAWLRERLGDQKVLTVKLETATSDLDRLSAVVRSVGRPDPSFQELSRWQDRDVNRKVRGDRRPEALWRRIDQAKRRQFIDICGEAMQRQGYMVPTL